MNDMSLLEETIKAIKASDEVAKDLTRKKWDGLDVYKRQPLLYPAELRAHKKWRRGRDSNPRHDV